MEFRDVVAVSSLLLAAFTFIYNWLTARGWRQKVQLRDELTRFTLDEDVRTAVTPDSVHTAKEASIYLSIELAETARRVAAKRARRTGAAFRNRAIWNAVLVVAVNILLGFAVAGGWSGRSDLENWSTLIYFTFLSVGTAAAYITFLRDGFKAAKATPQLKTFRKGIADAKSLMNEDMRTWPRPRRS